MGVSDQRYSVPKLSWDEENLVCPQWQQKGQNQFPVNSSDICQGWPGKLGGTMRLSFPLYWLRGRNPHIHADDETFLRRRLHFCAWGAGRKLVIMIRTIQVHELWDKKSARERNESLGNQIISQGTGTREGRERQKPSLVNWYLLRVCVPDTCWAWSVQCWRKKQPEAYPWLHEVYRLRGKKTWNKSERIDGRNR